MDKTLYNVIWVLLYGIISGISLALGIAFIIDGAIVIGILLLCIFAIDITMCIISFRMFYKELEAERNIKNFLIEMAFDTINEIKKSDEEFMEELKKYKEKRCHQNTTTEE